jgi:hypothetical protein
MQGFKAADKKLPHPTKNKTAQHDTSSQSTSMCSNGWASHIYNLGHLYQLEFISPNAGQKKKPTIAFVANLQLRHN